ncbi:YhzD family protein [Shouchella patagoniensis]|uniref:YhzD family protein n=1 Tax=Shouchella patagoniensis TaxID=228576 RepID=UPI001474F404|nr:YhzD family protein [Shouchella patagoniensis]
MTFFLTAFNKDSSEVLNERIEARTEQEAIQVAKQRLEKTEASSLTHRLTRNGKMILFAR